MSESRSTIACCLSVIRHRPHTHRSTSQDPETAGDLCFRAGRATIACCLFDIAATDPISPAATQCETGPPHPLDQAHGPTTVQHLRIERPPGALPFDLARPGQPGTFPSGSEASSYLRLIASCITQLKAPGPDRTCNESTEEEEEEEEGLGSENLQAPHRLDLFRDHLGRVSGFRV